MNYFCWGLFMNSLDLSVKMFLIGFEFSYHVDSNIHKSYFVPNMMMDGSTYDFYQI